MSSNFVFPEWLNANSVRAYPLSEYGTRMDLTGLVKLPDSLIADASIAIHSELAACVFFVSRVIIAPDKAEVEISVKPVSTAAAVVATITALVSAGNYKPYAFTGSGDYADVAGTIVIGDLTAAVQEAAGVFQFGPAATPFEHTVLSVSLPMVRSVEVYNGSTKIGSFTGKLKLQAGRNIRLTYVDSETVRIDASDGLNTTDPGSCTSVVPLGDPIRTINGIGPDVNGNFQLEGGECITVDASGNGLVIADTCSQSCCGCNELQELMDGLRTLETQYQTLKANIYAVQSTASQMFGNITAALS